MAAHIDSGRLKDAAERKVRLESYEWKHIEECRLCLEHLRDSMPMTQRPVRKPPLERQT